jgi:hypothetical protein
LPDISFDPDGKARFPTKYHGEVTLSQGKWLNICAKPERFYYRLNGEKVPTTVINPDYVRHTTAYPGQIFYYKKFNSFQIADGIHSAMVGAGYMAVIIDPTTGKVVTVYPTGQPKPGKEYVPDAG